MLDLLKTVLSFNIAQAVIIAILTAIVTRYLQPKGKLVWGFSHQHLYLVPRLDEDGSYPVRTQQIWIQNTGRKSVEEIEFVLNWKPQHLEVWDPRHYTTTILPDGRYSLLFRNLSSSEAFTISILDTFRDLPVIVAVRWKDGIGKQVNMGPQQIPSPRMLWILRALLLIGLTTILFLLLQMALSGWNLAKA
jgi:hypothetical protein